MLHKLDEIKQQDAEPVSSFFARIAAHYGLASAKELARDFELNYGLLVSGHPGELVKLAEITGSDLGKLVKFSPRSGGAGNALLVGEETIALTFSRRKHLYGCPECWAEDIVANPKLIPEAAAFIRLPWLFTPFRTCTRHDRSLVMVKQASSKANLYDTALMAADLLYELPRLLEEKKSRKASSFERYGEARLLGVKSGGGILDQIGINEVFTVCGGIGKAMQFRGKVLSAMDDDQLQTMYGTGFEVLSGGTEVLTRAICEMVRQEHSTLPPVLGPETVLGHVYSLVNRDRAGTRRFEPLYEFLANAVYDAIPTVDGVDILGVPREYRRFYGVNTAGREFGFEWRTIAAYANAAGIVETVGEHARHRRSWMDAGKAEALFRPDGGFIHLANLDRLGINKAQGEALIQGGLLETIVPRASQSAKLCPPLRKKDVDALLGRFLRHAEAVEQPLPGMVGLDYVSRQMPGTLSRVHDMILAKEIWVGRLAGAEKPYSSILIRADQVRAAITPGRLDTWQFAKAVGLRYTMVKEMVSAGDVVSEVSLNPAGRLARRTFDQSQVEQVLSSFTDLTSLAKKNRVRANSALAKLEAAGVEPVRAVKDGKVTLRLYRLQDLEKVSL